MSSFDITPICEGTREHDKASCKICTSRFDRIGSMEETAMVLNMLRVGVERQSFALLEAEKKLQRSGGGVKDQIRGVWVCHYLSYDEALHDVHLQFCIADSFKESKFAQKCGVVKKMNEYDKNDELVLWIFISDYKPPEGKDDDDDDDNISDSDTESEEHKEDDDDDDYDHDIDSFLEHLKIIDDQEDPEDQKLSEEERERKAMLKYGRTFYISPYIISQTGALEILKVLHSQNQS